MKKVNNIIQVVKKSYELLADDFHSYFNERFQQSTIRFSFSGASSMSYDQSVLNNFIDRCIYYRLGISDVKPQRSDIIYDLSSTIAPEEFEPDVDSIFAELVYCAYPVKLITKFKHQLEAHKVDPKAIELIVSKLEIDTN